MDSKKLAFIICTNNKLYYEECLRYINLINIPSGYKIDIIRFTEAESIASAYNTAMKSSDAKYKVYLHQDVFIYNNNFLEDIITIFQSDSKLGLLGIIGGKNLPQDADIWNSWNCGSTYGCNSQKAVPIILYQDDTKIYTEVDAVDGMLMATQYDIKWREDLDLGWDFYDISQSLEFKRNDYKVGIPFQKEPWCIHDCGYSKLNHYDSIRKKILNEYREFFSSPYELHYNLEMMELEQQIFEQLKYCIEQGHFNSANQIAEMVREHQIRNTNLRYALNLMEIFSAEKNEKLSTSFFANLKNWNEIKNKYDEIKFILRYAERNIYQEQVTYLRDLVRTGIVSTSAIHIITNHSIIDKSTTLKRFFN